MVGWVKFPTLTKGFVLEATNRKHDLADNFILASETNAKLLAC